VWASASKEQRVNRRPTRTPFSLDSQLLDRPLSSLLPTTPNGMPGFDALNRQCRTLEAQLDGKMAAYARLGAALARSDDTESTGAPSRHADVAREVEDLLTQVRKLATVACWAASVDADTNGRHAAARRQ
jgi:hypothetical protein